MARLQAGEAQLEAKEDATLGRTRSLAASLSYGFAHAFTDAERDQLAVLHLFRDTVDVDVLRLMGDLDTVKEDSLPELAELDRDTGIALLDRAAEIGLLTSIGAGYYQIHPALPWYFTALFTDAYGQPSDPTARRAIRAFATAMGWLGDYCIGQVADGHIADVLPALRAEEANLFHALDQARAAGLWQVAVGCLQGLRVLHERTGRDSEWARLVAAVTPDVTDPDTGGPKPGREMQWNIVTEYRVRLATAERDWPAAAALQAGKIEWNRDRAAAALATPSAGLTASQRIQIHNLAAALQDLGHLLAQQDDPGCLTQLQEALTLARSIGDTLSAARCAYSLGNFYRQVSALRDLDQAEDWLRQSLRQRPDTDRHGQVSCLDALGTVALERYEDAVDAGQAGPILLEHLNAALDSYQQALDLTPADDHHSRASTENQLGNVFRYAGDVGQALRHYQRSIQHEEARGNIYGAGQTRFNIALLLVGDSRIGDALHYGRAALDNFQHAGPGAASETTRAKQLIAELERLSMQ